MNSIELRKKLTRNQQHKALILNQKQYLICFKEYGLPCCSSQCLLIFYTHTSTYISFSSSVIQFLFLYKFSLMKVCESENSPFQFQKAEVHRMSLFSFVHIPADCTKITSSNNLYACTERISVTFYIRKFCSIISTYSQFWLRLDKK